MNATQPRYSYVLNNVYTVLLLISACDIYDPPPEETDGSETSSLDSGNKLDNNREEDASDAAGEGDIERDGSYQSSDGPWWIVQNEHGCETVRVPTTDDRPAVQDLGESLSPIYFAISRIRLGATKDDDSLSFDSSDWQQIGFDMDGVCTNSESCSVNQENANERACLNEAVTPYDGLSCRDNQLGKLSELASQAPGLRETWGFSEQDWNCELHRGGFSVIVKISNYNGNADDPNVRFDMYVSTGLQQLPGWNCRDSIEHSLASDWYRYPELQQTVHWVIAKRSINEFAPSSGKEVPDSKTADPAAYVRDGYLVAKITDGAEFWLNGERTPVPGFRYITHRGVLVGQLHRQLDDSWAIQNGTIAFVMLPDEYIQGFQEMGFCENMCNGFDVLRDYNKSNVDSLSETDEKLPNVPCNAISIGIAFDARQTAAEASDVEEIKDPELCPDPRHPDVPRQGCVCQEDGTLCLSED